MLGQNELNKCESMIVFLSDSDIETDRRLLKELLEYFPHEVKPRGGVSQKCI